MCRLVEIKKLKRIIKITVEKINKVMIKIFCFSILSISLIGCSSLNTFDKDCLILQYYEAEMFVDYNLMFFMNNNGDSIYVISEKITGSFINDSTNY